MKREKALKWIKRGGWHLFVPKEQRKSFWNCVNIAFDIIEEEEK